MHKKVIFFFALCLVQSGCVKLPDGSWGIPRAPSREEVMDRKLNTFKTREQACLYLNEQLLRIDGECRICYQKRRRLEQKFDLISRDNVDYSRYPRSNDSSAYRDKYFSYENLRWDIERVDKDLIDLEKDRTLIRQRLLTLDPGAQMVSPPPPPHQSYDDTYQKKQQRGIYLSY